jgi:hypothetical protein
LCYQGTVMLNSFLFKRRDDEIGVKL